MHPATFTSLTVSIALLAGCSASPTGVSDSAGRLVVSPSHISLRSVGDSAQLEAIEIGSDGRAEGPCADVRWQSSDNRVVTVTAKGKVIAKGLGAASVIAHCLAGQAAANVQVGNGLNDWRAFPEAQGWGADALTSCNRSTVQILPVTSLEDSGPGTLREAIGNVRDEVLTVVTFEVAGIITLDEMIIIRNSCLYVAGQTAPGNGITIRAPDKAALWLRGRDLHDVVVRYLRIRNGTNTPESNTGGIGMVVGSGTNVVLDHLSFSWAGDQLLMLYRYPDGHGWSGDVKEVTVQRTLLAEPFATSPVCYSTKGDVDIEGDLNGIPQWYEVEEVTFHHNAAVHCSHRAPMIVSRTTEVINNIVYNWNIAAMHTDRKAHADYVGNYFRAGPATRLGVPYAYEFSHRFNSNVPGGARGTEPDAYAVIGLPTWDGRLGPGVYLEGNVGPNNPSGTDPQWSMSSKYKSEEEDGVPEAYYSEVQYGDVGLMPVSVDGVRLRRQARLDPPPIPVAVQTAEQAWRSLIEEGDVGANRRLSCRGSWVASVDAVDSRVLNDARRGTGPTRDNLIRHEDEVGGYPDIDSGTTCSDSDSDGMPDEFEQAFGLDGSVADAALDADGDGYTNIEEYLNATAPR